MSEIKTELENIQKSIDAKFELAEKQAKENAGKINETLKAEIDSLQKRNDELTKRIDESEVNLQKEIKGALAQKEVQSFGNSLKSALQGDAFDRIKDGRRLTLDLKADMTVGADFSGEVIAADRVPGVKFDPNRPVHVRDILAKGSTSSDVVRFVKESAYSNGAATTAEGIAATQSDFDLAASEANVYKINTYLRVSEEMINDFSYVTSYIASRGPEKLRNVEDTKLLTGSGSSDIAGIITSGANFDTTSGNAFYQAVDNANERDVLVSALQQLAAKEYMADYIMLNPSDWYKLFLLKDTTSQYLSGSLQAGIAPNINGVPIVKNNAIAAGTFLVGNFAMGAQLWEREGLSVTFWDQDQDNVIKGFVTVKIQERIALTTYLPNAFIDGSFSTAKTALETP